MIQFASLDIYNEEATSRSEINISHYSIQDIATWLSLDPSQIRIEYCNDIMYFKTDGIYSTTLYNIIIEMPCERYFTIQNGYCYEFAFIGPTDVNEYQDFIYMLENIDYN